MNLPMFRLCHIAAAAALATAPLLAPTLAQAAADVTLSAAPDGRPASATPDPLPGMVEKELFVSGQANVYINAGTWAKDGKWGVQVKSTGNPYQTRILSRYPTDPAKFNGTVVVEWFNVSTGFDVDVDAAYMREELLAKGYAWVGVSAQQFGLTGLRIIDQSRYQGLSISADSLSYDIFSQAAQAVRTHADEILGGLMPRRLIAVGQSQSAMRLTTYANAFQPVEKLFDGIILHGRASFGTPSSFGQQTPSEADVRTDQPTKVLQLLTLTEVNTLYKTPRQPDSATVRTWEVAGAAHIDQYLLNSANKVSARDLGYRSIDCVNTISDVPFYRVAKSALRSMNTWISTGMAPPVAPRMALDSSGKTKLDANGNALGGIRLPEVDNPVYRYTGANWGLPGMGPAGPLLITDIGACLLTGSRFNLSNTSIKALYRDKADYVTRIQSSAKLAVLAGFMLPGDDEQAVLDAQKRVLPLN